MMRSVPSPLTSDFVRQFQPLPVSDRRALLKELEVAGVDHRDGPNFFNWLAERYRLGEAGLVDAALQRCCAKAEDRTGRSRAIAWLAQQAEWKPPRVDATDDYLTTLVAAARASSAEAAAIVDALAPNFAWFGGAAVRPVTEVASTLNAATVATRLERALAALAAEPDLDLLLRADALADEIERHLDGAEARAMRERLRRRVVTAFAALVPDDLDGCDPEPPRDDDPALLTAVAAAAETLPPARAAVAVAEDALRAAIGGSRAEQRAAYAALTDAQDWVDSIRADLKDMLGDGLSPAPTFDAEGNGADAAPAAALEMVPAEEATEAALPVAN